MAPRRSGAARGRDARAARRGLPGAGRWSGRRARAARRRPAAQPPQRARSTPAPSDPPASTGRRRAGRLDRFGDFSGLSRLLDNHVSVGLADDDLDVGVNVAGTDREVARVCPDLVVSRARDLECLDALEIRALARDRVAADDVLERRIDVLQLLVHDTEERLVARRTHLTLLTDLTQSHRKTSSDGNRTSPGKSSRAPARFKERYEREGRGSGRPWRGPP